ncbi:lipopolysaccharide biosynthesis protein [Microvirga pakistanensis]|uniref:lipopolysaccharide biosynthesis protein n=1 Tax=Microvirga pakistanensis TaxID=1682650 RepID=UPI00106C780B|nr:lipopolysaccharide biosynthesis protein [Microvirga pakistanensis]
MADDKPRRIIPLPGKGGEALSLAPSAGLRPQTLRRRILAISFVVCVLVPTFLGALYFTFIASDRYVAGAGFAVRGMDGGGGTDLLGAFTGLANAGSTTSDSYILLKFLKSRDMVERLEKDFSIREAFGGSHVDFLSRLDPTLEIEHVVEYWMDRIHTSFDSTSGIVTFEVNAFSPEDAERIAGLVLSYSKTLVNELSRQARQDAVSYAEGEVERAEARLRNALEQLRQFRASEQALDPARTAQMQLEIVGGLEKQLAETQARISALRGTVDANSPALRSLRRQAEALEKQIAEKQTHMSEGNNGKDASLTGLLATYETLEVERNFAQQAYTSSLASLEKARVEADRQQRYLAVYTTPTLPQYPLYPTRLLNVFLILIGSIIVWGIGALIGYSVRDHMS